MADSRTSNCQIHASRGYGLAVMFGFVAASSVFPFLYSLQSPSFNDHITLYTYFVPVYYSNLCLVNSYLRIEVLCQMLLVRFG